MVAHGLSAAALFILCGQLYERLHTRDIRQMGGLWSRIRYLPAVMLFFAVASLGMPGTGNFVGEFMILTGSFQGAPMVVLRGKFKSAPSCQRGKLALKALVLLTKFKHGHSRFF